MAYELQVANINYDPTRFLTVAGEVLERAKNEHRAAEIAYGELAAKADEYEKLANDVRGRDSQAYINYKNYANALRQHTDLLATEGIRPGTFRNIIQAKNDYARIISPIEEAWKARDREAQRQAKYLEQHPSAMFERDARDMSIDQWMANPHYVAKSIDRETVANRAKERYAALQNQIMQMVSLNHINPMVMNANDVRRWTKANAPWLYETMEKYGVNPDEVKAFMAGDTRTVPSLLNSVARETLGMYGMANWNTDYDHYSAEQNRVRRQNMDNILLSTITGEAPNAIKDSKFDKYTNDNDARILMNRENIQAEKDRLYLTAKLNNLYGKTGGKSTTKGEDWYNNTLSVINNPDIKTSEANYLKEMTNLVKAAGLGDRSIDYVEWLVEQAGINLKDLSSGNVTLKDPAIINAIKQLDSKYWKEEAKHTSTGAAWAGHSIAILGDVLGYLGTGLFNPIDAIRRIRSDGGIPENAIGSGIINKLATDLKYRNEVIHLYKNATNGSAEEKAAAIQALKKMGLVESGKSFEQKLKDLIDFDETEYDDLDAQTDAYIRNSATSLTGAVSNWEGTSKTRAAARLYTFLSGAISGVTKESKGTYDYLRNYKGEKVKVEDFINTAKIDKNGVMQNEPQVSVDIDNNGKVQVSLLFNGTEASKATKYKFDHRLIANGADARTSNISEMEQAVADYRAAKRLTSEETKQVEQRAKTLKQDPRYASYTEDELKAAVRNEYIYAKHVLAQSRYNKAKGEFFLSIGLNLHDINTRTEGTMEENRVENNPDAFIDENLTLDDFLTSRR